jgi:hypothetical protein
MRGRRFFGCWALLFASLALGSAPADAGGGGCCCCRPVYTLPLLFSNPVQTSFVYYPSYRRWHRGPRAYCGHRNRGCRHW